MRPNENKISHCKVPEVAIKPNIATSDAGCFAVHGGRETSVLLTLV
jgi:hypothetical protein